MDKYKELYVEFGGRLQNGFFKRNIIRRLDKYIDSVNDMRKLCDNTDIYYCLYFFDSEARNSDTLYWAPLYFDIDQDISTDESFNSTRNITLSLISYLYYTVGISVNEMQIYFSGSKGFHILIHPNVLNIPMGKSVNMVYKELVKYIANKIGADNAIDKKIYDYKRLFRVPNTINSKTGLHKIPITYTQLKDLSRTELFDLAKSPQREISVSRELNKTAANNIAKVFQIIKNNIKINNTRYNISIPTEEQNLPICIKTIFGSQLSKGNRNNTMNLIASVLLQNGYAQDKVLDVLYTWNSHFTESLPDKEIQLTVKSAYNMLMNGRKYGCTSIRETELFSPQIVCPNCRLYKGEN